MKSETPALLPKQELRRRMRAARTALSDTERMRLSSRACALLLQSAEWRRARVVALYLAVRGEADPSLLLQDAWQRDTTVLLPVCSRSVPGEMRLALCQGPESLRPGAYSIPEPVEDLFDPSAIPAPELILVPGLAFDRQGNRLGMGGGYYDRLLAGPAWTKTFTIGFAYAFQIVAALPVSAHDIPVQAICTDEHFFRIE